MMQEIILFVLYIEHRISYNVLYDRQNEQWEKLLATVTEPHHHIIVTYEEDSDIEVDGVVISVVPLVDFLLTT